MLVFAQWYLNGVFRVIAKLEQVLLSVHYADSDDFLLIFIVEYSCKFWTASILNRLVCTAAAIRASSRYLNLVLRSFVIGVDKIKFYRDQFLVFVNTISKVVRLEMNLNWLVNVAHLVKCGRYLFNLCSNRFRIWKTFLWDKIAGKFSVTQSDHCGYCHFRNSFEHFFRQIY